MERGEDVKQEPSPYVLNMVAVGPKIHISNLHIYPATEEFNLDQPTPHRQLKPSLSRYFNPINIVLNILKHA